MTGKPPGPVSLRSRARSPRAAASHLVKVRVRVGVRGGVRVRVGFRVGVRVGAGAWVRAKVGGAAQVGLLVRRGKEHPLAPLGALCLEEGAHSLMPFVARRIQRCGLPLVDRRRVGVSLLYEELRDLQQAPPRSDVQRGGAIALADARLDATLDLLAQLD